MVRGLKGAGFLITVLFLFPRVVPSSRDPGWLCALALGAATHPQLHAKPVPRKEMKPFIDKWQETIGRLPPPSHNPDRPALLRLAPAETTPDSGLEDQELFID